LQSQDRRLLERAKADIKSSLRIDIEGVSSKPAPAKPPTPNLVNEQVLTTPHTPSSESRNSRDRDLPPLPQDTSSTHSVNSAAPPSLAGSRSPIGRQEGLAASVTSVGPRNHINESEPASPNNGRSLLDPSSQSFDARSHSPSLAKLGRRSVVHKRVVEMQNSQTSSGSSSSDPRLSPQHTVATLLTRGRPVGMFETFLNSFAGGHFGVTYCAVLFLQRNRRAPPRLGHPPL